MIRLSKEQLHQIIQEAIGKVTNQDNNTFKENSSTSEEHQEMMDVMSQYMEDKPQVGIFWFDYINNVLFGVQKDDAEKYIGTNKIGTIHKLHKNYWAKQHHRAKAKGDTNSIFYIENNYTQIPRGRVFVRPDGSIYVAVGQWFKGEVNGKKVVDQVKVRELIADEFNLDDDFEVMFDEHWDIGHGWSGDKF